MSGRDYRKIMDWIEKQGCSVDTGALKSFITDLFWGRAADGIQGNPPRRR